MNDLIINVRNQPSRILVALQRQLYVHRRDIDFIAMTELSTAIKDEQERRGLNAVGCSFHDEESIERAEEMLKPLFV